MVSSQPTENYGSLNWPNPTGYCLQKASNPLSMSNWPTKNKTLPRAPTATSWPRESPKIWKCVCVLPDNRVCKRCHISSKAAGEQRLMDGSSLLFCSRVRISPSMAKGRNLNPVLFFRLSSRPHILKSDRGREHAERKTPFSGVRDIGLTPERLIKTRVRPHPLLWNEIWGYYDRQGHNALGLCRANVLKVGKIFVLLLLGVGRFNRFYFFFAFSRWI